jgi:hypothetical protein
MAKIISIRERFRREFKGTPIETEWACVECEVCGHVKQGQGYWPTSAENSVKEREKLCDVLVSQGWKRVEIPLHIQGSSTVRVGFICPICLAVRLAEAEVESQVEPQRSQGPRRRFGGF